MLTTTFLQPSFNASVVYFYTWPSLAPPRWILLSHLSNNVTIQLTGIPSESTTVAFSGLNFTQIHHATTYFTESPFPNLFPPPTMLQDNAEIALSQITSSKATYMAKASYLQP